MKTSKPEDRMFGIMKVGIVHNSPLTVALILTLSLITATSCDKHVVEDASWHSWTPGMVYTTNGYVTSFEKAIEECNTPEAIIFYMNYGNDNEDEGGDDDAYAYAVALHDVSPSYFSDPDTVYAAQGTSMDVSACDGETNTVALRYAGISSPIAQRVEAKYFIPSVTEMYLLYSASTIINPVIEQCGGDILPVDNEQCWYWTSTESSIAETDRAWRFSMYSGRYESEDKHISLPTRPVMIIRLHKAEQ